MNTNDFSDGDISTETEAATSALTAARLAIQMARHRRLPAWHIRAIVQHQLSLYRLYPDRRQAIEDWVIHQVTWVERPMKKAAE